jgi:hypothetical protein
MFNPEIKKYYASEILSDAGTGAKLGGYLGPEGALVGGVLGAGVGLVSGLFQKKKGNALLKNNPYPTQSVPVDELANQQQAERMADEGMPSEQYQQAQKNIQRNQAQAIAAQQDRRSGGANVGAIQAQSNDAEGNLAGQSAQMRRQNQLNLQTVNTDVAKSRTAAWDWNSKQKYLQNYQYGQSLVGAGNANMMSGADKLLGGLTQAYSSGLFTGNGGGNSGGGGVPAAYNYSPTLANTAGGNGSPANAVGNINPNSYSSGALINT